MPRAHMRVSHEVAWCASSVLHIRLLQAFFQYVEAACRQLSQVLAMLAVPSRVAHYYRAASEMCQSAPPGAVCISMDGTSLNLREVLRAGIWIPSRGIGAW